MYEYINFGEMCLLVTVFFGIGLVTGWLYGLKDGKDTVNLKDSISPLLRKEFELDCSK